MPAHVRSLAYRLSGRAIPTLEAKDAVRDAVRALIADDLHTHDTLERALRDISALTTGIELDLLARTADYDSFVVWYIRGATVMCSDVELRHDEAQADAPDEDEAWDEYAERIDRIRARLFPVGEEELSYFDGVDDLAKPAASDPLVTGTEKARLAGVLRLARRRNVADVPELVAALLAPANATKAMAEVRCSILRLLRHFDIPEVWDAVLLTVYRDADARDTALVAMEDLEKLAAARPREVAAARIFASRAGI
jgi:hypothetical protein